MAINWIKAMRWDAEGSAPSTELQTKGFSAGYKPPASIFNFFLNRQQQCTDQLQEEVSAISDGLVPITATSTDGITYTATADGITELYDGLVITIKPSQANISDVMILDLNGLGAKPIRRPLSFNTYVANTAEDNFLHAETPCRLMYHAEYPNRVNGVSGKGIWLMVDKPKVSAQDLYGKTPIESGGTGADNPKDALANLGLSTIEATTTDGKNYTATCEAISELYTGLRITIIPKIASGNTAPTLNLNELGAVPIKCKTATGTLSEFPILNALIPYAPISLIYFNGAWIHETYPIVNSSNFSGTLSTDKGGTGASTPEGARANLGAVSKTGDTITGDLTIDGGTEQKKYDVKRIIGEDTYDAEVTITSTGGVAVYLKKNGAVVNRLVLNEQHSDFMKPLSDSSVGIAFKCLWTNASQYQSFSSQTININAANFDEYDAYLITFGYSTSLGIETTSIAKFLGLNSTNGFGYFKRGTYDTHDVTQDAYRPYSIKRNKDKGIHQVQFSSAFYESTTNNGYCIPWSIWGIKW